MKNIQFFQIKIIAIRQSSELDAWPTAFFMGRCAASLKGFGTQKQIFISPYLTPQKEYAETIYAPRLQQDSNNNGNLRF